jgi:hypothetical protein
MAQVLVGKGGRASPAEVVVMGVGRATVRAFARDEARIGLLARGRDGLEVAG